MILLDTQCETVTDLLFHPFENHLLIADNRDQISVWEWSEGRRLSQFRNGNLIGSRLSAMALLNERDLPLLATGADDGVVRVFRDYADPSRCRLLTAWRSMPELLPDETGSGLVMDWYQKNGTLVTAGDVRYLRLWDCERETCTIELPTKSTAPITSLTGDKFTGHLIIAGFGDGVIRLYDRRLNPRDAYVSYLVIIAVGLFNHFSNLVGWSCNSPNIARGF